MKSALAIMIAAATILVIMTGSFAMSRMMNAGDHANCLLAIPGQEKCSGLLDPVQFATTHIGALLSISLGAIGSFAALFAALLLFARLEAPRTSKTASIAIGHSRIFTEGHTTSIRKQHHWISLLEKRDPSLAFAASA